MRNRRYDPDFKREAVRMVIGAQKGAHQGDVHKIINFFWGYLPGKRPCPHISNLPARHPGGLLFFINDDRPD